MIDRKHVHGWMCTQGKSQGEVYAGADPSIPILSYFGSTYTAAYFVTLLSAVCGVVIKIVVIVVIVTLIIQGWPILVDPLIQQDKQYNIYVFNMYKVPDRTSYALVYVHLCMDVSVRVWRCECEGVDLWG